MDDSLIFKLGLNTEEFKASLENAQKVVDNLANALSTLSNKKIALNVNITNTDFNSVFRRLNNEIKTSDRSAKELSEELDNLFSGKSYQKGFQRTFKDLNDSISNLETKLSNLFSDANTKGGFTRTFTKTVADAVSKGIEQGIENAFTSNRNKTDLTNKIQRLFSSETSAEGNALVKDLADLATQFENIKRNITSGLASTFREIKTQYPELADMNGSEMLKFFSKNADMLTPGQRHWSQREIAADVGKNAARAFQEEMKDKDVQNALVFTEEFAKEMSKATQKLASVPTAIENSVRGIDDVIDAKTKQTQAQAKIAESRARVQAAKEEDYFESRLSKQEKAARRESNYYRDMKTATEMYRADYATDDKTASAQRGYIQAMAHIRTLAEQARQGNYPTLNTLISAQNQRQKASITLNNRLLSDQLGIDELNEKIKKTSKTFADWGSHINKVANIMMNINQAMGNIQSVARNITYTILNQARTITYRLSSTIRSMLTDATDAYKSLETSMIGFTNFFGEKRAEALYQQIKEIAAVAPGLGTTDLAEYVRQIAPVSGGNEQLALNASLGMLKTIQYGGANGSTEMEYVIKNIRDVLSKGTATQIDIRQFNRAMPILEQVLGDIGESQLIKDGKLSITKDNVDTILAAFAKLNTDQNSKVAGIFDTMNKTLTGQWEQLTEQFTTNLMQMLKDSGVYGRAQNLLAQFNAGEYAQTALIRFGRSLKNFIDNINWFKVQEYGEAIAEGFGIIGNAIKELAKDVLGTVGGTDFRGLVVNWSEKLAGFIKSLGNGVSQIIRLIDRLGKSSLVGSILKLAPATAVVLKFSQAIMTFSQNVTKALGSLTQLMSTKVTEKMTELAKTRQGILDSIPNAIKANSTNQRVGKDYAGNTVVLGQDFEGFAGTGVIQTINKQTGKVSKREFANYSNAEEEFALTTTEITKEASKFQKASVKMAQGLIKTVNGIIVGINGLAITDTISNVVESLDMFGESASYIASGVRAAGHAITAVIVGSQFGTKGGIVGAFVGLGIAAFELGKAFQDERDRITNTAVNKALTEERKNILKTVENALIAGGALSADISSRTNEESYAFQQLSNVIANTGTAELQKLGSEGLVKVYTDALKNKSIAYDTLDFDFEPYENKGRTLTPDKDRDYLSRMYKIINDYDLLAGHGYSRAVVDGQTVYTNSSGNPISAEELWDEYFGDEKVTTGKVEALEDYVKEREKTYSGKWDDLHEKIEKISLNEENGWSLVETINTQLTIANQHLANIAKDNPTSESNAAMYSNKNRSADDIKKNLDTLKSTYNEGLYGFKVGQGKFGFSKMGLGLVDPNEVDSGANYGAEYGIEKIFDRVGQLTTSNIDEEGKRLANQFLGDVASGNVPTGGYERYMSWVNDWRKKLTKYFVQAGIQGFASGGSVLSKGIDTVPAMLSPGEFVMKQSAVKKAGLGVMYALNHGNLAYAARQLGSITKTWNNHSGNTMTNTSTKTITNNIHITNRNMSSRLNSYYSLANRLSF